MLTTTISSWFSPMLVQNNGKNLRRRSGGGDYKAKLSTKMSSSSSKFETSPILDNLIKLSNDDRSLVKNTNLRIGEKKEGKVRDRYEVDDKLILITTDRQSAFDRVLTAIPFKGQVLNTTSEWWFKRTEHIVPNALLSVPDDSVSIMKKLDVIPIEIIVRGYMTGSTETSIWTHYRNGSRNYCGNQLPDNMVKNQKLSENILTPTTKGEADEPITPEDIVSKKYMSQEEWDYISSVSLELFRFGQAEAQKKGLILVDTKYEFGKDKNGKVYLIDELHTPDSSRYWILDSYEKRFRNKEEPENVDKEFLRLWFSKNCDPYNDETLPEAPIDLVHELSRRYIYLYQTITSKTFLPTIPEYVIQPWGEGVIQSRTEQIETSIQKYLNEHNQKI